MRRLLTWIAILIACFSLPLSNISLFHAELFDAACLQLLAPDTGDVLTVDATTGVSRLDARGDFPLSERSILHPFMFSPDRRYVLDAVYDNNFNTYKLALGRRSTTYRRRLTPTSYAVSYVWSPDSQHIAFTEKLSTTAYDPPISLTIANVGNTDMMREIIPNKYKYALEHFQLLLWSPDSMTIALFITSHTGLENTVMLRTRTTDQSTYVSLPNQWRENVVWSPDGQSLLVFTREDATSTYTNHTLTVIQPDGHILKQTAFHLDINPAYGLYWSPDGKYFFVVGGTGKARQVAVFSVKGDLVTSVSFSKFEYWSDQPHTLLYVMDRKRWSAPPHTLSYQMDHTGIQTTFALNAATGQTTLPVADIPLRLAAQFAPRASIIALTVINTLNHILPRTASLDMMQPFVLFGRLYERIYVHWSPDNQELLMTNADTVTFTLYWMTKNSTDVKMYRFAKRGTPGERLEVYWLTEHIILMQHHFDTHITTWRINTETENAVKLSDLSSAIEWHDDKFVAIRASDEITLYRDSDGVPVFSHITPISDVMTFSVAPDEQAALLYPSWGGFRQPGLVLVTGTSEQTISNGGRITKPAWSPDGTMFAFAMFDQSYTGWVLKVISSEGILLHRFSLPAETSRTPYQQARWTTCG